MPARPTTLIRTARNGRRARDIVIQPFGSGRCSVPTQSRRRFLTNAAFAGAAGLGGFGTSGKSLAAEPPPETTTVRLEKDPGICRAPQYIAEALLRAEGFTDIRHVERDSSAEFNEALAQNDADFGTHYSAELLP